MPTLRQSLGHGRSACAGLAGSTRIHLQQLSPGAFSLVREFGKETVPGGVVDRAGQPSLRGGTLVSDFTVHFDNPAAALRQR
jgi:hypothetical protein